MSRSMKLSRREVGLIYGLLEKAGDEVLEQISVNLDWSNEGAEKGQRLSKLIASNLRQKLRGQLAERS